MSSSALLLAWVELNCLLQWQDDDQAHSYPPVQLAVGLLVPVGWLVRWDLHACLVMSHL
jgi:hypothetical protein